MTVIYEPKGKAREYAPLAVNLYDGCQHGCLYCYAPHVRHKDKVQFINAKPRPDIIERLTKEASKSPQDGNKGPVLLCFTCDPYFPIEATHGLTRQAIQILHQYGYSISILTKAGELAQRDFDILTRLDCFGQTLTFVSPEDSKNWEPGAALPEERCQNLKAAHAAGIPTWASLEPVIDPVQSLQLINVTHDFVDEFKVGKWNHDPRALEIDWRKFREDAIRLLQLYQKKYYIKEDLRKYVS
jgi:DNA repair photolyase